MRGIDMRAIILIIIGLFIVPSAIAGNIMEVGFWIDKDDKAKLDDVVVVPGDEDQVNLYESEYSIEVFIGKPEYMSYFPVRYEVLTDPPTDVDRVYVLRKLPYLGNKGKINVYKYNSLLLTFDLSQLCQKNGKCENFENYLTCEDCKADHPDYVCVAEENSICDPDCNAGVDIDCITGKEQEKAKGSAVPYIIIFSLTFAGILIYIVLRSKKAPKRSQQKSAGKRIPRS